MYDHDNIKLLWIQVNIIGSNYYKILFLDSLIYFIRTQDFYNELKHKPSFLEKWYTSNFLLDHPYFTFAIKKEPGRFTDETGS